jgi:hypothetical protein
MKYAIDMGSGAHDIHNKFHENWVSHSNADKENTQTHR